jgi:hypothetical protein
LEIIDRPEPSECALKNLDYLIKIGLVSEANHRLLLTVPILRDYIQLLKNVSSTISIDSDGRLYCQSLNLTRIFTDRELQVMIFILKHPNELIQRDIMGKLFWQEKWMENGSDWALNQAIKRLRNKIINAGVIFPNIKTIKGQGYVTD